MNCPKCKTEPEHGSCVCDESLVKDLQERIVELEAAKPAPLFFQLHQDKNDLQAQLDAANAKVKELEETIAGESGCSTRERKPRRKRAEG